MFEYQYLDLVRHALASGARKADRTGTGTRSLFAVQLRHDVGREGLPALTTKKVNVDAAIAEMQWVLSGGRSILPLLKRGIRWWSDWPLRRYLSKHGVDYSALVDANGRVDTTAPSWQARKREFEEGLLSGRIDEKWADLGAVYGHNLRSFEAFEPDREGPSGLTGYGCGALVDQVAEAQRLLTEDPDSRRIRMTTWHPAHTGVALPPCHGVAIGLYTAPLDLAQRISIHEAMAGLTPGDTDDLAWYGGADVVLDGFGVPRRRLSLHVVCRSTDIGLGLPVNAVMYAYALEAFAHSAGMYPGELVMTLDDAHVYETHVSALTAQLERAPGTAPVLRFTCGPKADVGDYGEGDVEVIGYEPQAAVRMPIAV
jgi:thymidylate synthase